MQIKSSLHTVWGKRMSTLAACDIYDDDWLILMQL